MATMASDVFEATLDAVEAIEATEVVVDVALSS